MTIVKCRHFSCGKYKPLLRASAAPLPACFVMAMALILWFSVLGLWCAHVSTLNNFHFKQTNGAEIRNLSEYCKNSDCVVKCCPEKEIMLYKSYENIAKDHQICIKSSALVAKYGVKKPDDYSDIDVFDKDIKRKAVKNANEFKFIHDRNFIDSNWSNATYLGSLAGDSRYRTFLLEDGKWVIQRVNYWHPFTKFEPQRFCIEHEDTLFVEDDEVSPVSAVVWVISDASTSTNQRAVSSAYGLLVSCFFLLLVLGVYAALPHLRNLAGMMLMACISTYFAFFLIRAIHVFSNENQTLSSNGCITLTVIFYYLMLATFCWMNVMSFDIWWTFRSIRKSTEIHRRGVVSKFRWYCAYAWGVPALPTTFVVVVDQLDLTHLPYFVKPHIFDGMCFFESDVHLLYVSIPILILICVNVVMFLLTTFNIWQVRRAVNQYKCQDSTNSKKDEYRFLLYVKLSLVMGVPWILEVIGNVVDPESKIWIISDLYNALIGVFIFIIFVCKRKIFLQLCSRFSIDNALVRYVRDRDDSRAADAPTKSHSQNTDASDVEPQWTPSYKEIKLRAEDL